MRLTEGVYLHFIHSEQFKNQRIKLRFSAPLARENVASRVLIANMLEVANKVYPTAQAFRQKLASLYGADFSTRIGRKGAVHLVDLDISYLAADYLAGQDLTAEILEFLRACLFQPLTQADSFDDNLFRIEQKNMLTYLEAETEDHFHYADQAVNQLFYQDERLSLHYLGNSDLIKAESPQSSFRSFQRMLTRDRIDIFCLGQFDQEQVVAGFEKFGFLDRQVHLDFEYSQPFSSVIREKIEKRDSQQSVLELAYHLPVSYGSPDYFTLVVLNCLLGASPQSKLFVNVREAKGLAYTIGSDIDSLTSCLKIYAGIDRNKRQETVKEINRQWQALKRGQFSLEDLNHVKTFLRHSILQDQDRQISLIEEVYRLQTFEKKAFTVDKMLKEIDRISKEELVSLTSKIKLQALYFMEGEG